MNFELTLFTFLNTRMFTQVPTSISKDTTQITTLPNGVRVTTENTPGHFSAVGVYIDAGSRYETPETFGVSHILDRLAYKSTKTYSLQQIQSALVSLGGNIMCASSRESIMYQAAVFSQDLSKILALFSDVICNPCITPEEVEEQKQTTLYEIQEISQKSEMILPELLHTVAFKDNTLGHPMLCPVERLNMMTPQMIKGYMSTWYHPERMVIAAAGAQHEDVVEQAIKYFGNIPKSPELNIHTTTPLTIPKQIQTKASLYKTITTAASSILHTKLPSPNFTASQRAHYTGGSLLLDEPLPHTHVYIAFEGLSILDPDIYGLAILQMLLGGGGSFSAGGPGKGMYTRLYTNVLNRYTWIESCMCFNHCYTDSGLFGIMASCHPDYNHSIVDVMAQQLDSVTKFKHEGAQSEFLRAKNQLKSSLLMNLESRMVQLEDLGRQVQVHGYKVPMEEMCKRIDDVTLDDLARIANKVIRGQVYNEGNGTGEITVVAQGELKGLKDIQKVCKSYGLGRVGSSSWIR